MPEDHKNQVMNDSPPPLKTFKFADELEVVEVLCTKARSSAQRTKTGFFLENVLDSQFLTQISLICPMHCLAFACIG